MVAVCTDFGRVFEDDAAVIGPAILVLLTMLTLFGEARR